MSGDMIVETTVSHNAADDMEKKTNVHHDISASLSQEKLEELCPNGEYEYFLEKLAQITEEEALEVIIKGVDFFSDDWNFPKEMMAQMQKLLQGPKVYDGDYELDLKVNAVLIKYHSPYPEVRAIAEPTDDPTIPIETPRAYFLGIGWAILGTCCNTFFNSRFPNISVGSAVIQILLYPCGKFCEKVLPDWGFSVRGKRWTLNPGVWTYKEQMFATITFNVAIYTTNTYTAILVQKNKHFYEYKWVTTGYQVMVTIFVQMIGMGFAGIMRRFTVYPVKAIWPYILPTVAMNRALLRPEVHENINGWTLSRYNWFYICFGGMFLYYWIPGYLFTALSTFNWMTWIAPNNKTLAVVTGSSSGLGLNPWPTFDWNVAVSSYAALSSPFFSTAQMFVGSFLGFFIILGMWYSNQYWTGYLPINSSAAFANDGTAYNVSRVLSSNGLDPKLYQSYSPPFYSAGMLLTNGANFAFYPIYFLYIICNQWKTVKEGLVDFYKGLVQGKPGYSNDMDVHSRMMRQHKEVPDWWFLVILVICIVLAIIFVEIYPVNTPVWLIFMLIGINIVYMIPLSILTATTGTTFGLNNILQIITGYALPNNPNAFLVANYLGGWSIAGHADNYIQDLKMAYYCKIPSRAVFRSQISAVLITSFVAVGIQNWVFNNIDGLCDVDQPNKFNCLADGYPMYTSSLMWGLLGSKRTIDGLYPILKWCWLIGFLIALVFVGGQYIGFHYGPRLTARWRIQLSPNTYEKLDRTIIRFGNWLLWVNPVLLVQGIQHWSPSNMSYKIPGMYLSYFFMYYLRKRYTAWWEKYNYVLSAAFTAAIACAALLIFFSTGYYPKPLKWWGNTVSGAGVDGAGFARLPLPERGYFGPDRGSFP